MTAQDPLEPPPPGAGHAPHHASTPDLVRSVSDDVRRLVRAEIALAKAELNQQLGVRAGAIGMIAVAGLLAVFALFWLIYTVFAAWHIVVPEWAAALLTALVLFIVAGALVAVGVRILRRPMDGPERAIEAGRETQAVVKAAVRRG